MILKIFRTFNLFAMGVMLYDSHMSFLNSIIFTALVIGYGSLCYKDGMSI